MKLFYFFVFLLISCKSAPVKQGDRYGQETAATANSCMITGRIITVIPLNDSLINAGEGPKEAMVEIKNKSMCGNSAVSTVKEGDTIRVYFVFTLEPSSTKNPELKSYPRLKPGSMFEAMMEERIRPGDTFGYRVYGYRKL